MATIITRVGKGSALTNSELDSNFTNLNDDIATRLSTTNYSASDVLSKLLTVDGTGSGLDADLLRGLDSSSSNTPDTVVVRDSSGNASFNTITASLNGNANTSTSANSSSKSTNIAGGSVNMLPVQSSFDNTVFIAAPTITQSFLVFESGSYTWKTDIYSEIEVAKQSGDPAGSILIFASNTAPNGFLKANGAAISRTSYADLFAAIGTTFGIGDGSTTFNLPDLRGEFIRGWDDGRGIDAGRSFGSFQLDEFKAHTHPIGGGTDYVGAGNGRIVGNTSTVNSGSTGGDETRPRNIALLACIKY